jgi:hypothetical protein
MSPKGGIHAHRSARDRSEARYCHAFRPGYLAQARRRQSRELDYAMPVEESETRQCPFCKEEVKADAIRCKHCQAAIRPLQPDHRGICPFCKETINPEAIRCSHCGASLAPPEQYPYYAERPPIRHVPRRQVRVVARRGSEWPMPTRPLARSAPEGCNDYEIDSDGTWTFIGVSENGDCMYELTDPIASTPGF